LKYQFLNVEAISKFTYVWYYYYYYYRIYIAHKFKPARVRGRPVDAFFLYKFRLPQFNMPAATRVTMAIVHCVSKHDIIYTRTAHSSQHVLPTSVPKRMKIGS